MAERADEREGLSPVEGVLVATMVVPWVLCTAGWVYVTTVGHGSLDAVRWLAGRG